ncbi:hypothetical protein AB3967_08385 [Pseudomonas rhodesiae]|uniref:hypothetical protein n=1 Tax=Pseudomonas rhodesiae TaxID=76760 RepID=UPI00160928D8
MSDYSELERRAQAAIDAIGTLSRARQEREFNDVCTPQVVKDLIAENKRLAASVKLNLCDYPAIHQGDVDLLVAFVTGASQIELAKVHNCTPPNISRKICRVKERLGWREGMLVSDIRDRAEQLRALASKGAVVTADLMAERDQLKAELEKAQLIGRLAYNFDGYKAVIDERDQLRAEVAGLKTGYEAYERVNAELKAENEALRGVMSAVVSEIPGARISRAGNAPGHCHSIPGVWDEDNGSKAGKECAWCKVWNYAVSMGKGDRP